MIKFKHIFSLMGVAGLLLFGACSNEEANRRNTDQSSALTMTLSLDALGSEIATRTPVPAETGEDHVDALHLFFFNASSDQSGTLVNYLEIADPALNAVTPLTTAGTGITPSAAYTIIGVANIDKYVTDKHAWVDGFSGVTEAAFRQTATVGIDALSGNRISPDGLLMHGAVSKAAGTGNFMLKLTRSVARFDVKNTLAGHELMSVTLWNAYKTTSITGDIAYDYAQDAERTAAFYEQLPNTGAGNISGGLYAYENQSTAPDLGDKTTTCLIVGIDVNNTTRYFRINVAPEASAQAIRRNKVYVATINGLINEGYASEQEAYESRTQDINYTINNWDLGDNGVVVSDMYSILAVPVKTIQIDKAGTGATDMKLNITTFSTLANPAPLKIDAGNSSTPEGINVSVSGNVLTVVASPLADASEVRKGTVILTYAGLTASISLLQSYAVNAFLTLTYQSGWNHIFEPVAAAESKEIYVNASGSWTATVIGDAFTFGDGSGVLSNSAPAGLFTIKTANQNPSKTETIKGFVLVRLDDDPVNQVAVVSLIQSATGGISMSPVADAITFDGFGSLTSSVNTVILNSVNLPLTISFSGGTSTTDGTVSTNYFNADFNKDSGALTITATGTNDSDAPYTDVLTVTDNSGATATINLTQRQRVMKVIAASPTTVTAAGGLSGKVQVTMDGSTTNFVPVGEVGLTVSGVSRTVYNHEITVVNSDGTPWTPGSTEFYLKLPKIYYPNRDTDIRIVATIKAQAGVSGTYVFTQSALKAAKLNVWATSGGYGTVNDNNAYFTNFYTRFRNLYSPSIITTSTALTTSTSMLNINTADSRVLNQSNYNWANINSWLDQTEGVIFVVGDYTYGNSRTSLNHSNSPYKKAGFTVATNQSGNPGGDASGAYLNTGEVNKRVYQFIMQHASYNLSSVNLTTNFHSDRTRTEVSAWPTSATALMLLRGNSSRALLVIDPVNRLVFLGDGEVFGQNSKVTGNRDKLMVNLMDYLVFTAKYGSHFSDMLIDNGDVSAPWDSVWGANAWPN